MIKTLQPGHLLAIVSTQAEASEFLPALIKAPAEVKEVLILPVEMIRLTSECAIPATGDHPDLIGYMVGPDDRVSGLWPTRAEALSKSGIRRVCVVADGEHPERIEALREECKSSRVRFVVLSGQE